MNCFDKSLNILLDKKDLTFEEAECAMREIMTGNVPELKLSAWLTALRMKGEVSSEIAGCAKLMRDCSLKVSSVRNNLVDIVGTGGDGAHTINVSTAAAFTIAGAGVAVAKHGNRSVSSKSGSADVLSALGIEINLSPEQMGKNIDEIGMSFLFAPALHPAMKYAMPVRKTLGIRTIFNVLGPMSNPAHVEKMLIGVYDKSLCRLIAEACRAIGFKHLLVVHGSDGLDEITLTGKTFCCELCGNKISEYKIDPVEFGFKTASLNEIQGGSPKENAEILEKTLKNEISGPKKDIVIINAAGGILAADKADNWNQAVQIAEDSISSGRALNILNQLRKK